MAHLSSKEMLVLLTRCEKDIKSKGKKQSNKDDDINTEDTLTDVNESLVILDEIRIKH